MIPVIRRFFNEYIFYIFIILFAARSANFLESRIFIILAFSSALILFIRKGLSFDRPIIILIILWSCINIIAYLRFGNITDVKIITFISVTSRYLFPYLVFKIHAKTFFKNIETIIYTLGLISLPIFTVQLIYPTIFYDIAPYLNTFTVEEQQAAGGWYAGFYMFSGWANDRNCGFMWEPGAFAFMLILGVLLRLYKNNVKFDKYVIIYIIAILSTFSTMGYAVLFLVLFSLFLRTRNPLVYVIIIPAFAIMVYNFVNEASFMMPKIQSYVHNIDAIRRSSEISGKVLRINRFGIILFAFKESLKWPFGYGIFDTTPAYLIYKERLIGPSTYADLLLRWGWAGLFIFLVSIFKFVKRTFPQIVSSAKNILFIAVCASVVSYDLLHNALLLSLLYFPYISKDKLIPYK